MRLKSHAAVQKKANFSVTHWVTESLQAQWPALVKNIYQEYIQSQMIKKRTQHEEIQLHYYVHLEQEDWF